jgi:hypothetical protein
MRAIAMRLNNRNIKKGYSARSQKQNSETAKHVTSE